MSQPLAARAPFVAASGVMILGFVVFFTMHGCGMGSWVGEGILNFLAMVAACGIAAAIAAAALADIRAAGRSYLALVVLVPLAAWMGTTAALAATGCLAQPWSMAVSILLVSAITTTVGLVAGFLFVRVLQIVAP